MEAFVFPFLVLKKIAWSLESFVSIDCFGSLNVESLRKNKAYFPYCGKIAILSTCISRKY